MVGWGVMSLALYPTFLPLYSPTVRDINISLWRTPEEVKFDKRVFMNQGEWELLYVLSQFHEFSVEGSERYAEMKFYVRSSGGPTNGAEAGWGVGESGAESQSSHDYRQDNWTWRGRCKMGDASC